MCQCPDRWLISNVPMPQPCCVNPVVAIYLRFRFSLRSKRSCEPASVTRACSLSCGTIRDVEANQQGVLHPSSYPVIRLLFLIIVIGFIFVIRRSRHCCHQFVVPAGPLLSLLVVGCRDVTSSCPRSRRCRTLLLACQWKCLQHKGQDRRIREWLQCGHKSVCR